MGNLRHFSLRNSCFCSLPEPRLSIEFIKRPQPHPGLMPPTLFSQQFPFSYTEVLKTCWSFFFFFCLPLFILNRPVSFSSSSSLCWSSFPDTVSNDSAGDKTGAPAWRLLFILSGLATASSQQAPSFQDERLEKKQRLTSHAAFMLTRSRIPPSPY